MTKLTRPAVVGAVLVLACGPRGDRQAQAHQAAGVSAVAQGVTSTSAQSRPGVRVPRTVGELDAWVDSLATIDGQVDHGWSFQGDSTALQAIATTTDSAPTLADTAVVHLVNCLGREDLARVTLDGHTVPIGIVCYLALQRFVYHEETAPDGGLTPDWVGNLEPDATPEQLRAAQRAWRTVVRERTYNFL